MRTNAVDDETCVGAANDMGGPERVLFYSRERSLVPIHCLHVFGRRAVELLENAHPIPSSYLIVFSPSLRAHPPPPPFLRHPSLPEHKYSAKTAARVHASHFNENKRMQCDCKMDYIPIPISFSSPSSCERADFFFLSFILFFFAILLLLFVYSEFRVVPFFRPISPILKTRHSCIIIIQIV